MLDVAKEIRETVRRAQSHQKMHVIRSATDSLRDGPRGANSTSNKSMEAIPPLVGDERPAILGAENNVHVQAQVQRW